MTLPFSYFPQQTFLVEGYFKNINPTIQPSTTLDPIAQIIWWSEHLSKMKKVTQSMLEDVIERIEEVLEQNGELVKVFYGDYIHHHFNNIMTSSVEYDDVIKTELIS